MKTNTLKLVKFYLETYSNSLEKQSADEIASIVTEVLSEEELIEILNRMFDNDIPKEYDVENCSKAQLAKLINNDSFVIGHLIEKIDQDIYLATNITSESVAKVFEQLGLETHYLAHKKITMWDKYDHSNYKSLLRKLVRV